MEVSLRMDSSKLAWVTLVVASLAQAGDISAKFDATLKSSECIRASKRTGYPLGENIKTNIETEAKGLDFWGFVFNIGSKEAPIIAKSLSYTYRDHRILIVTETDNVKLIYCESSLDVCEGISAPLQEELDDLKRTIAPNTRACTEQLLKAFLGQK